MAHTNQLELHIHPDRSRGVLYLHVLAWLIFILVPVISAWSAINSMDTRLWFAQFGIMSLRSMAVFYMMYLVLIPQLLACGGAIKFLTGTALSFAAVAAGTTLLDSVFYSITGISVTPINPELGFIETSVVWLILFGSLTLIALAGRFTFDWFTITRSWYKGDFEIEHQQLQALQDVQVAETQSTDIWVRSSGSDIKLTIDDIHLVESMKDYLIYTGSFGKVMVYQRLKDAESQLAASGFVRVHRSFLVNTAKIDRKNAAVITIGDVEIPIGPTYRERLM